ncbi:hypothetical protein SAMD00079811_06900 [Scytonema sp. HK-05]|uniref:hypothetical protein n=1 Tax=Scytonema sp. HK-05 TaxID=1137095 RepID=UPI0009370DF2|nr:hypothetical protein [Scytonema sp. HK-05]OKH59818.1 hypothetical protein NIES2130_06520 [Scytonema sp. HK-05]BAY43111.1 hypothetical protein SAMD00079811_06900 [Scytonema sp. HK-05]
MNKEDNNKEHNIDEVQEPITNAPPEVRQIIDRVWQLEKSRLDKKINSHINDDILAIVKEAVR